MTICLLAHAHLRARAIILWSKGMNSYEIAQALNCEEPPVANYLANAFDEAHKRGWSRERLYSYNIGLNWSLSNLRDQQSAPIWPRIELGERAEENGSL